MELLIDGEIKDTAFVNTTTAQTFVFNIEISEGSHDFAIGWYNAVWDPSENIDRNLYVDKTIITLSPILDIIEAEEMSYHTNGRQQGEYWNLWGNGTMNEDVYFPNTGNYRFEIIAKADLAYGVGPEMELLIDGEIKGKVFVNTTTAQTFMFYVEISEGSHDFAIGWYNAVWYPSENIDRNLYVDKTIVKNSSTP